MRQSPLPPSPCPPGPGSARARPSCPTSALGEPRATTPDRARPRRRRCTDRQLWRSTRRGTGCLEGGKDHLVADTIEIVVPDLHDDKALWLGNPFSTNLVCRNASAALVNWFPFPDLLRHRQP